MFWCFILHAHGFYGFSYSIAKPLSIIYNQLFSVAFVPDEWKVAMITAVHKKGPTTDCSNYRPISITCVTSKLLERIIVNQIKNHPISNNLFHTAQHGFLTGLSTCTNLLESLRLDSIYRTEDKHNVVIAYVDFSKAFDVVSHNKLFVRL